MFKLIKNAIVYAPRELGKKDLLIAADKIALLADQINVKELFEAAHIIDARENIVVPGFIDCHVHILGGGGEGGFKTRTPEIKLTDITRGGVTTIVGCLGTDGYGRSLVSLIAKARALEEEGLCSYLYTGSYQIPVRTITGRIEDDIMLIEKFIGVGEIALSDHRSSQPAFEDFARAAASARVGGILSGKAGIVNIHLGDGKTNLDYLERAVQETELPITQFLPTHINRNPQLFCSGLDYAKKGGYIDFTTSSSQIPLFLEQGEVKCSQGLKKALDQAVPIEQITFSSDGQGSLPRFDHDGRLAGMDVGQVSSLYKEVKDAVLNENVPLSQAIKVITTNPAKILKLPQKGEIKKGLDADLVILDQKNLAIDTVIARGEIHILNKKIIKKGTFE